MHALEQHPCRRRRNSWFERIYLADTTICLACLCNTEDNVIIFKYIKASLLPPCLFFTIYAPVLGSHYCYPLLNHTPLELRALFLFHSCHYTGCFYSNVTQHRKRSTIEPTAPRHTIGADSVIQVVASSARCAII